MRSKSDVVGTLRRVDHYLELVKNLTRIAPMGWVVHKGHHLSGPQGPRLAADGLFDEEIRPHNELFRATTGVRPGDRVLDVGCGTGRSTREAARAASGGSVLGVDISAQALDLARRLSAEERLDNVRYQQADVAVHDFPPGEFDLAISRFGVMFFADPVAAFGNIGRALRPGACLVRSVHCGRNSDGNRVRPGRFRRRARTRLDAAETERAHRRLRDIVTAHATGDGVFFGSRAWIVTAHRN
jgi:SAM-dependent methyltransferase